MEHESRNEVFGIATAASVWAAAATTVLAGARRPWLSPVRGIAERLVRRSSTPIRRARARKGVDMHANDAGRDVARGDLWVGSLRARLIETGYDAGRVDELITASLARFGTPRIRDFVPLLVERSVYRTLRGE